jgi:hypothetical protein
VALGAMSIFHRMFDYFELKPKIQSEITFFVMLGLIPGIYGAMELFVFVINWLGFAPDTKMQEVENGGWITLGVGGLLLIVVIFGMLLGAVIHALYLTLSGQMKFWEAYNATVLNKYPFHWFR